MHLELQSVFNPNWQCISVTSPILHLQSVINDMPDLSTRVWQLSMKHLLIDMPDMAEANLLPHFQQAVTFISSAIDSGGKVLVHCQAGVSRSATVSPVLVIMLVCHVTTAMTGLADVIAHANLRDTECDMIAGVAGIPDGNRKDWCGQRLGISEAHVPFCQS